MSFSPANPVPFPERLTVFLAGLAIMAGVFAVIVWLNAQAVKRLETEIAALDMTAEA